MRWPGSRASVPSPGIPVGAGHLGVDRAVGLGHHAGRVGELAEARAVRAHGEELAAVGVPAQRIAARVEHERPGDRVLDEARDVTSWRRTRKITAWRRACALARPEVRDLAQVAAEPVDREDLAVLRRIGAEGVGGRVEEGTPAVDGHEIAAGVTAAETRKLDEVLSVDEEGLVDVRVKGERVRGHARPAEGHHVPRAAPDLEDWLDAASW